MNTVLYSCLLAPEPLSEQVSITRTPDAIRFGQNEAYRRATVNYEVS